MPRCASDSYVLGLRAGELVEIRSEAEILATLDEMGTLDALPFMPEMLAYCGRRVRVYKRAHKTCDTIEKSGGRRIANTVHLTDLRCDGHAHGGCDAACLLFWKEAWLKRVPKRDGKPFDEAPSVAAGEHSRRDRGWLSTLAMLDGSKSKEESCYRCQATELRRASSPLKWWDIRQYAKDLRSGNVGLPDLLGAVAFWLFRQLLKVRGYRLLTALYDGFQRRRGGTPFPFRSGSLVKTPREILDLKAGELVRVKAYEEILKTLDATNRNRGLRFDAEMVPYCGGTYRVRGRVERLIDEKTGRLVQLSNDCIILDDVVCGSRYSANRMFCPRSIFSYWREIWLVRVDEEWRK